MKLSMGECNPSRRYLTRSRAVKRSRAISQGGFEFQLRMLEEKSHAFRRLSFPSSGRRELTPDCRNAFANDARCAIPPTASSITNAREVGSPSIGMKPTANYSGFASPIASYSGYHYTTPLRASRGYILCRIADCEWWS